MGHKHAALMAQYAEDAKENDHPWELWENKHWTESKFSDCKMHPGWYDDNEYRRKPKTVVINGIELEDDRFTVDDVSFSHKIFYESALEDSFFIRQSHTGTPYEVQRIGRGIGHKTQEGAIAFCKARLGIKD